MIQGMPNQNSPAAYFPQNQPTTHMIAREKRPTKSKESQQSQEIDVDR